MAPTATESNVTADGRQENRISNYTKFWQNDMSKEKDVDTANRLSSYTDVVNGAWITDTDSFLVLTKNVRLL